MSKPLKAFITYSHKDEQKRKKLRTRLAVMERNGEIKPRDDTDIAAGGKASQEDILKEVANSDILLFLVSADSLASENCNKELTEAVNAERRVIPIILESCDWMSDRLSDFEVLPDKGKPINKWQPQSDGWQNVVDGIRKAVEEMQTQADSASGISEKELRAKLAFQHGNVLMIIKQFDSAIEHYSHAIALNPNIASTYNNRGIANRNNGDFNRAIEDYTKAIDLNPSYTDAYSNRGVAYHSKFDFDRAIEDYTKATDLSPNSADIYNNRGTAFYQKGDFDRAMEDFNTAIHIKPDYTGAYYNRGITYRDNGDIDRAIEDYNTAIQLQPDSADAYAIRGVAYCDKSDFVRAIEDYTRAIELKPDLAEPYAGRGVARLHLREWEKARKDLTAAKNRGMNTITAFQFFYENVADFEERSGVTLPVDIAALLTPPKV